MRITKYNILLSKDYVHATLLIIKKKIRVKVGSDEKLNSRKTDAFQLKFGFHMNHQYRCREILNFSLPLYENWVLLF